MKLAPAAKSVAMATATLAAVAVLGGCGSAANADVAHFADVTQVTPVTHTITTPKQVCHDVAVQHRRPLKDKHEIIGTAIGAVVGGAVGNQIGGGNGKKVATVAGAVAGGYAGKKIEEAHEHPQISTSTERRCKTVQQKHTQVVAYDVTWEYQGTSHHVRMQHKPGNRIKVKQGTVIVGDDRSSG